jgi:glycosyltransferase involved in cell wall biosynthesis
LIIGITCKTHPDGRKKENLLIKISKHISPNDFSFKIMGSGWEKVVNLLKFKKFIIEYFPQFNYEIYCKLIPSLDFFLYYTFDEGTMGFLDALAAGVKTIVTPQGYHLDAINGIIFPITGEADNLEGVLNNIIKQRNLRVQSVSNLTWEYYAKKHFEIWEHLLCGKDKNR